MQHKYYTWLGVWGGSDNKHSLHTGQTLAPTDLVIVTIGAAHYLVDDMLILVTPLDHRDQVNQSSSWVVSTHSCIVVIFCASHLCLCRFSLALKSQTWLAETKYLVME